MPEEEIVQDEEAVSEEEVGTTDTENDEEASEEPSEESEDVEALKKRLAKAEAALVKSKKAAKAAPKSTKTDTADDEIPDWGKQILESDKKRSFGYAHNLSPETVDKLHQYSGGNLTEELLEDPAAKGIVRALETTRRNAANTPKGGTQPLYKGKTYAEVVSDPDASPADKQAAMEAKAKAITKQ